ncbi:MAG: histidine kinase [Alistipes sp.]|nr:histidine kinase [Alistipes sp.]
MGAKRLNIRKQVIGENLLYAIIWVVVFLVPFMNAGLMSEKIIDMEAVVQSWLKIIPFFVIFLLNNLLLYPYLLARKRYIWYVIVALPLIVVVFMGLEVYEQAKHIGIAWPFGPTDLGINRQHISLTVFPWWGNIIAGLLMFVANDTIRRMYGMMQADEDKERLERQNIQAEMYYLKHQINPHFLMNTLNNIHALIDIDVESAKRAVIQLSDMMRYVVYDTGGDAISLKQDITFIKNYIELMRIRYTEDVEIEFTHPQNMSGRIKLPPLILIVFVENAFKHGISYNHNSYIHIDVKCSESGIEAYFENSLFPQRGVHKPGIGLENVRKRLDLIYGKGYTLEVNDKAEDKYSITLKIPYLNDKVYSNR